MLLANGTASEVGLAEGTRGVRGAVKLEALVGALCVVVLNTCSAI